MAHLEEIVSGMVDRTTVRPEVVRGTTVRPEVVRGMVQWDEDPLRLGDPAIAVPHAMGAEDRLDHPL